MVLGPVQTMCYVISNQTHAVVIDPAHSAKKIQEYLNSQRLTLQAILLTHGHFDHIGAVNELALRSDVPVYAHKREKEYFQNPDVNLSSMMYERLTLDESLNIQYVTEGATISSLDQVIKVFHVPGHTPGSLCYYFENEHMVFTGDTLFAGGIGRTDFIYGDHGSLVKHIKQKLMTLPQDTLVYPGHGECTTVETEAKRNIFLK